MAVSSAWPGEGRMRALILWRSTAFWRRQLLTALLGCAGRRDDQLNLSGGRRIRDWPISESLRQICHMFRRLIRATKPDRANGGRSLRRAEPR